MTTHARAILHDLGEPENLLDGPPLTSRWFALLALLLLAALLVAAEYAGKIISISDGDTMTLLVPDGASYQQVTAFSSSLSSAMPSLFRNTCLIQDDLGRRNIQHTLHYTAAHPARFENLWR